MSIECNAIHELACELERHGFPFDESKTPLNETIYYFKKAKLGIKEKEL